MNGGFFVSPLDLSPNFAGILMGLGNSIGNCFSIAAPLVVQFIVTDEVSVVIIKKIYSFIIVNCFSYEVELTFIMNPR